MAGRPRSIDRGKVLDAAEALVMAEGASALSFDAVAKAAGITKGGVQYAFGTRDKLIRAMIARWGDAFEQEVSCRAGPDPSPEDRIRAHLAVTRDADATDDSRAAVMMTALVQQPEERLKTRDWYTERLADLDLTDPVGRRLALAFLAGEGAFLLKSFGLLDLAGPQWAALFQDMLTLAGPGSRDDMSGPDPASDPASGA